MNCIGKVTMNFKRFLSISGVIATSFIIFLLWFHNHDIVSGNYTKLTFEEEGKEFVVKDEKLIQDFIEKVNQSPRSIGKEKGWSSRILGKLTFENGTKKEEILYLPPNRKIYIKYGEAHPDFSFTELKLSAEANEKITPQSLFNTENVTYELLNKDVSIRNDQVYFNGNVGIEVSNHLEKYIKGRDLSLSVSLVSDENSTKSEYEKVDRVLRNDLKGGLLYFEMPVSKELTKHENVNLQLKLFDQDKHLLGGIILEENVDIKKWYPGP